MTKKNPEAKQPPPKESKAKIPMCTNCQKTLKIGETFCPNCNTNEYVIDVEIN